ncbi:MAG: ParB N-terminal domain-containing protein [Syntrophobacterales bacterium]|nr:MAG: ParB N-terminal domain-containing protein [Syntrophobacterales bacterium]
MRNWPSGMGHRGTIGLKTKWEQTSMGRFLRKIGIDAVDSRDHFFCMTFHPNLEGLRRSIEHVGLLQPIIVREKSQGSGYQVISGFKRLTVCEQLGLEEIEIFSYRETELGDPEGLNLALHENLTTRGLNLIEKSMVLNKLIHRFGLSEESITGDYMPLLGLQPNIKILGKVSQLVQLRAEIKRYIVEEKVSLENAAQLLEFPPEDQAEIGRLVSKLKLGENKLKEVLTFLREISLRDGLTVRELIQGEVEAIASDSSLSKVQSTHRVRRRLREMRFPQLTELERDFRERRKGLGLGPGISLNPPPFFEGDTFRLEFGFKDMGEFKAILLKLMEASERKELGEMIDAVP